MLDKVPPEVLSLIAYHSSCPTLLPPTSLLCTSRSIHDAISPGSNPRLYAKIYRSNFDIEAVERRLGPSTAAQITQELRKRVSALYRLRRMLRRGDLQGIKDDDVWTIYLMLIENDGKNVEALISKDAILHLPSFLKMYHSQHLLSPALQPGYPAETVGRALVMWIAWLLTSYNTVAEPPQERDERLFVLRPYVFAPQQYEAYFAPWTILNLPLSSATPPTMLNNPYQADLSPKSRTVTLQYFGRETKICPPILSHAAILRFFTQRSTMTDVTIPSPFATESDGEPGDSAPPSHPQAPEMVQSGSLPEDDDDDDDESDDERTGPKNLLADSRAHDRDFSRLLACHDPFTCPGLKPSTWKGSMEGCWEGNFSFFDFDAFREMLAGQSRALYEGPFGEQHQVWRLKETFVRPKRESRKEIVKSPEETDGTEGSEKGKGRVPLTGPMTNAGFPTDVPSSTGAGLATPSAEMTTLNATIQQQLDSMEGYEVIVPEDLDSVDEEQGVEILVTGVGHSAWGRFILKGRVRTWDGMTSLVKEYAPDSRGKWIYRGYVTAGDTFVGRWRDTFTPEAFIGYEGTFILNRRDSVTP